MIDFSDIKYQKKDKYRTSCNNFESLENVDIFIKRIRQESFNRQVVLIDSKMVIFGVEGPVIFPEGKFWTISAHVQNGKWGKHYVLVSPNLNDIIKKGECFIRLDSGCLSAVLGDNSCDCLEQLRIAQRVAIKRGGVIIHIPGQDGRGWQEEYKMAHQRIMHETRLDTITIAAKFYGDKNLVDIRTFDESALILKALGFPRGYKFNLGTRNPKKVNAMIRAGFNVSTHAIEVNGKSKTLTKNLKAKYEFFHNHIKEKSDERN